MSLSALPAASPSPTINTQVDLSGTVFTPVLESALGTVQSTGLVVNLVTVAAGDSPAPPGTAFDPALSLSPLGSASGACTVLAASAAGYRCSSGGR